MQDEISLSDCQLKRRKAFLLEVGLGKFDISDTKLFAKSGISIDKARLFAIIALLFSFAVPLLLMFYFQKSVFNKMNLYIEIILFVALQMLIRYYLLKSLIVYYKTTHYRKA